MDRVQFDEEDPISTIGMRSASSKKQKKGKSGLITRLAISSGFAKNQREAQRVLLILALLLIAAAILYYLILDQPNTTPLSPDQLHANLYHTNP